jgi:hypothetical protein
METELNLASSNALTQRTYFLSAFIAAQSAD